MKARLRIIVAASLALLAAGTPALAQDSTPPPQNDVVGPPQLKDFTLNGTVTRPAPTRPAEQPRPAPSQDATRPAGSTSPPRAQAPDSRQPGTATPRDLPSPPTQAVQRAPDTATSSSTTPATDFSDLPPPPPPSDEAAQTDLSAVPVAEESAAPSPGTFPSLTWILLALAAAGAAAGFLLRQRSRESFAGVGEVDRFEAPAAREPRPAPPAVPAPKAPEPEPADSGIVSARLRPWLEIEFAPTRGVVDGEKVAIGFQLSVYNSGSIPARDVILVAALINGGPMQEQQIRLFFDNPTREGDKIPVIPPLQRITLDTGVALARDQVRPIEIEGRQLFVPMVAFNVTYQWSSNVGQTSASFLVGKQTSGEKLAPFRLDLGSRIFRNLAAREHDLRVRK